MNETITLNGLTFRAETVQDDSRGAPWKEEDGHGPVSDWRRHYRGDSSKRPGEILLSEDRGSARFYDFAEAVKIAKRDGWGIDPTRRAEWEKRIGRALTPGQVAEAAARDDYERLRRWCNDDWSYVGVVVTLLDAEGEATHETESLWGIESDAGDYLDEGAKDCAEGISQRIGRKKFIQSGAARIRVRN